MQRCTRNVISHTDKKMQQMVSVIRTLRFEEYHALQIREF